MGYNNGIKKFNTTRKFKFRSDKPAPLKKKVSRSIGDSIKQSAKAVKYSIGGQDRLVRSAVKGLFGRRKI